LFVTTSGFAALLLNRLALVALLAIAFDSIAPAQTAHLSSAQIILNLPSGLDWPQAVAVDGSGNIFIADADNKRVLKVSPSPSGGFTESTVGTGLVNPYGVAVDAAGNVYIADIFLTTLLKETPSANGYIQTTIGSGLYDAVSVAVDKQGNVYGVEINNSFIGSLFKETLSGNSYTQSFIPVPGTHGVATVAVDGKGNLFVNDGWDGGLVYELSPTNDSSYTTKEILTGGGAIAIDANNSVYVATLYNIEELTPNGSGFTTSYIPMNATTTPYGYFDTAGLAVDANGNLYFDDLYTFELVEEAKSNGNFGLVNVGNGSYPVSMYFTFDTSGTLGSTSVMTQGSPSPQLDFSDAGTGGCYSPGPYNAGGICEIDVNFVPSAAGVRSGAAELLDVNGNPFATGYVEGIGVAPVVNFSPGNPISESIASDGSAVAVDALGNLFTVASGSSTAFKDTPAGGASNWIEVPVGSGLGSATGIAIDGAGDLYIADQTSREIVKETLTSNGYSQSVIANHSNGLKEPTGVAVDDSGNVYVSDLSTNAVYKETPSIGGYVQSAVPTSALNQPNGVAADAIGAVYIADTNNNRVLKETPIAGGYIESTVGAGLSSPTAVAVDAFGNVYISETSVGLVLKETLAAGTYVQSTIASGITPYGLAIDSNLNLYVAGSGSQLLVKVDVSDGPVVNFAASGIGQVSSDSPKNITLSNAGNAPLILPVEAGENNPNIGGSYSLDQSNAADCPILIPSSPAPTTIAPGGSCLLAISFGPMTPGLNPDILTVWDNTENLQNASQGLMLQGSGTSAQAQTINFPAIPAQTAGTMLNLSATATSGLAVSFASLTPAVCTVSGNTASLIAAGNCTIQASQAGNNQYNPAANVSRSFMVNFENQTINFPGIPAQNIGTTLNLSATASSGLAVSFMSLTPTVCTVSGNSASLIASGNCTIQASQPGNKQYAAALNVNQQFAVKLLAQTITGFTLPAQLAFTPPMAPIPLTATGGASGNPVKFAVHSGPGTIACAPNCTLKITGLGTVTVFANQAGNADFAGAPQVAQSIIVSTFLAPLVSGVGASSVSNVSERLSATINPENAPTTYFFVYGLNTAGPLSATVPKVLPAGVAGVAVSVTLAGLQANTTYYYRVIAKNLGGQVVTPAEAQPWLSFTTP
jgi:streptogramin lyase